MDIEERNKYVMYAYALRLRPDEAVEVLKGQGFDMAIPTYKKILGDIKAKSKKEIVRYANNIALQHIEVMEILDWSQRELSRLYSITPDSKASTKLRIMQTIIELQPVRSAFSEKTKYMIPDLEEKGVQIDSNELKKKPLEFQSNDSMSDAT